MKKYVYKPYSKIFPDLFQKEKERIASALNTSFTIEHVGSTAIPNLGGKGIIDICIATAKEDLETLSQRVQELGYEFKASFSTPDRLYFIADFPDPEEGFRRYHVHLTHPSSKDWKELIGFRDYLRNHPEACKEYAEIKIQAVCAANLDGKLYRKMKEPMFQKISALIPEAHKNKRNHA